VGISYNIAYGVSRVKLVKECLGCRLFPGSSVIAINHCVNVLLDRLVYAALKQAYSIEEPGLIYRESKRLLSLANSELGFPDAIVNVRLDYITTLAQKQIRVLRGLIFLGSSLGVARRLLCSVE
jgi:hypothetical protein